jgi:hypothetical protein
MSSKIYPTLEIWSEKKPSGNSEPPPLPDASGDCRRTASASLRGSWLGTSRCPPR